MTYRSRLAALLAAAALLIVPELRSDQPRDERTLYAMSGADQRRAEEVFASAEAAIYFPEGGEIRWLATEGAPRLADAVPMEGATLREFDATLENEFPGFEANAWGPYLLKRPSRIDSMPAALAAEAAPIEATAAVFTDSFENGMGSWTLDNNTLDLYSWGATICEARTGTRSADAMRGGVNTLSCTDPYGPNVTTTMVHGSCEGIAGASQAWLDVWIRLASETNVDSLGFYYADSTGQGWGYGFSGSGTGWFHLVFNLKQWYRLGDLSASTCPRLIVQFRSDAANQPGFGARIDDLTIGNAAPGFLSASISATPASGTIPLTVNFSPLVTGASAAAGYEWSFGDPAKTTATTPTAAFTYTAAGDYHARLRVDDTGVRAYAHTIIRASAAAVCTLSCSASSPSTVAAGAPALFQATATATGCSGAPSYAWTFGDGQTASQQNASHPYAAPGTYSWSLTASVAGATCTKSGTITVKGSSARRRMVSKPPDAALASGVIGAAGGTLSGGGLTLTIPPGSFTTSTTVSLKKSGIARQEGDVSDTYAITGLPANLNSGMTLEIGVGSSSLGSNEGYYIAADASMYVKSLPSADADIVMMVPLEATLFGASIRVTIPPNWRMPSGGTAPPSIASAGVKPAIYTGDFRVKGEKRTSYESTHFDALTVPSQAASATSITTMLEAHYETLTSLGFSFACRNDSSGQFRRIPVELAALGTGENDKLGYHVSGGDPCGTNWLFSSDSLVITTSYSASDSKVKAAAAHELFHLLQDMYSPGGARANLWLKEASSTWLEIQAGNPCPDVQNSYNMFAWNGLFNSRNSANGSFWTSDREARHGYGASYALLYGTKSAGNAAIRILWENIKGANDEVAAAQGAFGTLPAFWTLFSKAYIFGGTTGGCAVSWASFDQQEVTKADDLPKSFSIDGYPLSSRSWAVKLTRFAASSAINAPIVATGLIENQSVVVYDARTDQEIAELTPSAPEYAIPDLRDRAGSILVLLFIDRNVPTGYANQVSTTNEVTLRIGEEVKLEKVPWSFQYQWTDFELGSAAIWNSSGSGTVEAPKGSTVVVDTVAGSNVPTIRIRAHGAPGKLVVEGTFLATIKPTSGRKTNSDGSYTDFSFTNPQFVLDGGKVSPGENFRYEIPADFLQRGIAQSYTFDVSLKYYDKDGKQTGTGATTGQSVIMVIDFERVGD